MSELKRRLANLIQRTTGEVIKHKLVTKEDFERWNQNLAHNPNTDLAWVWAAQQEQEDE